MIDVIAHEGNRLVIGRQGENQAVRIVFDVSSWLSLAVDGEYTSFTLVAKRPGDGEETYPCVTTYESGKVYWVVNNADVANVGHGTCELVMTVGEAIAKSVIYNTLIHKSLAESEDPPEEYQAWVDTVIAAGATATSKAAEAAESATEAASSASAASGSAGAAATEASAALASASSALESATAAVSSATEAASARDAAVTAQEAAETASGKAQGYASAASGSAEAAAASAKTAADDAVAAVETEIKGYVESAGKSATAAETAQGKAEAAQTASETAQGKAEAAQTAAETAASSVSASAAQIATNTSDISKLKEDLASILPAAANFYRDSEGYLCEY